jgi:hypothetical protein
MGYGRRLSALPGWLRLAAFALTALSCYGQFGGPTGFGGVGGFGGAQDDGSGQSRRRQFSLNPWLMVNGIYGRTSPFLYESTQSQPGSNYWGGTASGGLGGGKAWRRTTLAGAVSGGYNFYNSGSPYRGGFGSGVLGLTHMFSHSVGISISEMAGSTFGGLTYGGGYGGTGNYGYAALQSFNLSENGSSAFGDPNLSGVVNQEVFGNRVSYTGTSAMLRYQPDRRWVTGVGASFYEVKRQGTALSDSRALSGYAMANYRLSRRAYLGAGYVFSAFEYPKVFGSSNAHQAFVQYALVPNERSRLTLWAGGVLFRATAIGEIALDPGLAELLGQPTQLVVQNVQRIGGIGGLSYSYSWRQASFAAGYTRGLSPGNGALYASLYDSAYANLSRPIGRRMGVGLSGSWVRSTDWIVTGSHSEVRSGGVYWSCHLGKGFSSSLTGGIQYSILPHGRGRGYYGAAGIAWSPADSPFQF